jgi:hypothetical protein
VNIAADGSFTYTPLLGLNNVADTFTYMVGTTQVTVTINIGAPVVATGIVFVRNTSTGGTGTQADPLGTGSDTAYAQHELHGGLSS